jgi:glycolate oxidase iron-sulfur subunit
VLASRVMFPDRAPAPGPLTDRPGRVVALADQCVQCGLCLPACPTYRFDQLETESPRGRIALAKAWALEILPPTAAGDIHLDHCLGCRRCEVVCPAGVQYGPLLFEARSQQRERRAPRWKQRGAEWVTARPDVLRLMLALYRFVFPLLPRSLRPLARPPVPAARTDTGTRQGTAAPSPAVAGAEGRVALFVGCVAGTYETNLRAALLKLCTAAGVTVVLPEGQTCCGSLHAHAGNAADARRLAQRNRAALGNMGTVLTLATGCHEAIADALHGLADTRDALDFIARNPGQLRFRPSRERIALHLPCTQRNVARSDIATRALLARVPGLEIVDLDAGFGCCGAAGTQMLTDPVRAAAYRRPLLEQSDASGATRLLSANIGCRLHFANGTRLPVQHPLEFLAECLDI